jgi:Fur family ferric uptake transcriptional regulator
VLDKGEGIGVANKQSTTAMDEGRPLSPARRAARVRGAEVRRGMEASRIERLCIEHGLKMTGQRRVIARVLSEATDHPDVEELYRRASRLDARISIATVYRTVRLLEEKGILARRDFGGGRARYEASEQGRHHHLIDIDTGRVVEFHGPEVEQMLSRLAATLGYELVSIRLELFGRKTAPLPAPDEAEGASSVEEEAHAAETSLRSGARSMRKARP